MKRFLSVISSMLLALMLAGCSTTTMDPAVGKADYQTYIQWVDGIESSMDNKLADGLSQVGPKNAAEDANLLNNTIEKSLNDVIASGKALNLRHEEVRKLRDMTIEVLNIYKQVLPAYLLPTEANLKTAEAAQTKLAQLEKEGDALMEKLDSQFGK